MTVVERLEAVEIDTLRRIEDIKERARELLSDNSTARITKRLLCADAMGVTGALMPVVTIIE
jgi:hypothetical protein